MRVAKFFLAVAVGSTLVGRARAQVDGSGTEISAATRLKDYLQHSRYPETNRLLQSGEPPLFETPLLPGDASGTAAIIGFSGEKLQRGSLQIFFRVKIQQAGFYSFRTQLASEQGKPLVEVLVHQKLKKGEHTLQFLIYGKAIRDSGFAGPFVLSGIVAEKLPPDGLAESAQQGALRPYKSAYRTQTYRAGDFTDKEFTSPEKAATIRRLMLEVKEEQSRRK